MDIPVITVGKAPVPSGDISGLSTAMPRGFLCRWAAHEWFFSPVEQELVSVGIGDNRTGEMIVLGHVRHKLVCSPDFEALLEHRHR